LISNPKLPRIPFMYASRGVAVSTLPGFMDFKIAFKVEIRVDWSLRI
jgi:hypothetical protein